MAPDYYIVLGIERGANLSQIKHAYRKAIKRYHPDTIENGIDPNKFMEAQEAYQVLSDSAKRRIYDAGLRQQGIPVQVSKSKDNIGRRNATRLLRWKPSG